MKITIIIGILFCGFHPAFAQDSCACCTDTHRQFDFWVGDWNVYDTLGNRVGENTIEKLVSECILSEYWRGKSGVTGRSFNYFNPSDSTWNQVWIDGTGSNLILKGKFIDQKMVLQSDLIAGRKVEWYRNRITWIPNHDGTVIQHWEILDKDGKVINQLFKGIYKKK